MPRLRLLPPVTAVTQPEEATPVIEYLMNRGGQIAIDTETTGLHRTKSRVLFWSMATEDKRFFLSVDRLNQFDCLFQRKDIRWLLTNAKFDKHMLKNMGYDLRGEAWDIIDMDAMDDDTRPHGLKEQSKYAYGANWGEFKDLFLDPYMVSEVMGMDALMLSGFKKLGIGDKLLEVYDQCPEIVEEYASCDAFFTYMRAADLMKQLDSLYLPTEYFPELRTLLDYYRIIEMPLTQTLWKMERVGINVDVDYVKKIDGPMRDGIRAAESRVHDAAGKKFNVRSTDELRGILFGEKSGFGFRPVSYTTGKGKPVASTDESTLSILMMRTPKDSPAGKFLKALVDHRHLAQLHSTYIKKLLGRLDEHDTSLRCKFNQSVARTGRLSSSDPNMQNIPARNDPYKIRGAFTARNGKELIDYDYPQIEFRIAAVLSGEEGMMESIRKGWDVHNANTVRMYKSDSDVTYEAVVESRRKKDAKESLTEIDRKLLRFRDGAKTSGLGCLYGEGSGKMAHDLGCSKDEAQELINTFFTANKMIHASIQSMHSFAHETEMTYTMLGRIRRLHRINSSLGGLVAEERRQSYNTLIQGSGAEMLKLAMLQIDNDPDFQALGGRLLLTVHDELVAEAPKDTAAEVSRIMKAKMSDPYNWGPIVMTYPVPVDPEGARGHRWSDLK